MHELHIVINNKIATYMRRDGFVVCNNDDYMVVFAFDAEWDAYPTKTARFIWNGLHTDVPFTGNTVALPMVKNTTLVTVGVYAGDLRTTTPARIECKKSILCGRSFENPNQEDPPEVPEGYIYPTGEKTITENGSHDVREFATAVVAVQAAPAVYTVGLDFSDYEKGSFTETLSDGRVVTHTVVFDGDIPIWVDTIDVSGV